MKIIYTSPEDFIKQEIDEYGEDYVDAQFDLGYEPGLVTALGSSFYTWVKVESGSCNVLRTMETNSNTGDIRDSALSDNRICVASDLNHLSRL